MKNNQKYFLIFGDFLAIAIITFIGFATHNETDISFLPRMSVVFFPLAVAWFLIAPWLGLFQNEITHNARQLWRPVLSAIFATPLAAVLRGIILHVPIIPIFAVVLGATTALGMLLWRSIWFWLTRPK